MQQEDSKNHKHVGVDVRTAHDGGAEAGNGACNGTDATKIYRRRYEDFALVLTDSCEVMYLSGFQWNRVKTDNALWDTGAFATTITKELADRLGVEPEATVKVGSMGGNTDGYCAHVNLKLGEVMIPFLRVNVLDLTKREEEARREGVPYHHPDVWIGMDVISQGRFEVDSSSGKTVLTFEIPD